MLTNGPIPTTIRLLPQSVSEAGLRPGQSFQTTVQGTPGRMSLQLGGMRVPLEETVPLAPGQPVLVEVGEVGQGLQLRIVPRTPAAESPAGTTSFQRLIAQVLEGLGALEVAETAPGIVPRYLPHTAQLLRDLFSLFLSRGTLGRDLQHLSAMLGQAAADGAIAQETAALFTALAAQFNASQSTEFKELLQQLAQGARTEARLARALDAGTLEAALAAFDAELRVQVARLRGQEAFLAYLRGKGQLRRFEQTMRSIAERLDGGQLQNLRGLEMPYIFLELPASSDSAIRHGQIHFFGEGSGKRRGFDKKHAILVLDLATSRLGDLWITLRVSPGHCQCHFRATTGAVVSAIAAASGELAEALAAAGYPQAEVQASLWDGDRFRQAGALMQRFAGLDLNA